MRSGGLKNKMESRAEENKRDVKWFSRRFYMPGEWQVGK